MTQDESTDLYSSPFLVDYYDIVAPNSKSVDDVPFYWRVYQELKATRQPTPANPFVVMDLGTGTGRVLHGIAAEAVEAGDDLVDTVCLGVDNAQLMLDKAERIASNTLKGHVEWILGSALDLESAMAGKMDQKVDWLIFSIGSISHLSEDGQPEAFLKELGKVLRPGSGRAYVSIYDGSLLKKKEDISFHQPEGVSELPSSVYPGVYYRESNHRGELHGKVKHVKFDLQAVDRNDGKEEILESNLVSMKMRQWEPDELTRMLEGTGLSLEKSVRRKHETFYAFRA